MTENNAYEVIENLEEFDIATFCTCCGKQCDLEPYNPGITDFEDDFDVVSVCCGDNYVREDD